MVHIDSEKIKEYFGKRLKELRLRKKYTQAKLAELSGVSEDLIGMIERGVTAPSFKTLSSLSKSLGVSVMELFNFNELE